MDEVIAHIDKLSEAVKDLASAQLLAAAEQRAYVEAEKHAMKRRTKLEKYVFAALVLVVLGLAGNGVEGALVLHSQQGVRDAQKTNRSTLTTIQDCTDPAGKCAQRGQQATADAVAQINQATAVAAFCGAHSATLAAAKACAASTP